MKKAIELKNLLQEVLKRFENLNIVDLETTKKVELRNQANEKIKFIGRNCSNEIEEDDDKPCTSKSKEADVELSEKEKKKQEMLKV